MPTSPTVLRRTLGRELERLRERARLSQEQVAEVLDCDRTKVARIENGRTIVRRPDLIAMLDMYDVDGQERDALLAMAKESRTRGWWQDYGGAIPSWLQVYIGLEAAADSIRVHEGQLIHGLLQVRRYAEALVRASRPDDDQREVDARLDLRMQRQERLSTREDVTLHVVMDEAAIRRMVGGPDVMREQLAALVAVSERPNTTVQVIPFAAGSHAALGSPFTLLDFGDGQTVYLEHPTTALYLEKPSEIARYVDLFDSVRTAALDPDRTRELIRQAIDAL